MTSMGLFGGQTVMSVDAYERVAPYLQDLFKPPQVEVSTSVGVASHREAAQDWCLGWDCHFTSCCTPSRPDSQQKAASSVKVVQI